jgi:hypothetical protein
VADSAVHVLSVASMYATLVEEGSATLEVPGLEAILATTNVDTMADLNAHVLKHFTERSPNRLATLLGEAVDRILATTRDVPPETTPRWLGDSQVPVAEVVPPRQRAARPRLGPGPRAAPGRG